MFASCIQTLDMLGQALPQDGLSFFSAVWFLWRFASSGFGGLPLAVFSPWFLGGRGGRFGFSAASCTLASSL